jgi:hypothetical protein
MVKLILKITFVLSILMLLSQSIFGYQILVDALVQRDGKSLVEYVLNMSAYKETIRLYNGEAVTYAVRSSNEYFTSADDFKRPAFNMDYLGSSQTLKAKKDGRFIIAQNNEQLSRKLPDYYSVGRAATIFHKELGTNYNGRDINIGYQVYRVGEQQNYGYDGLPSHLRDGLGEAQISAGPGHSQMGIVGYLTGTEYQYEIVNGIYVGYHRINPEPFINELTTIKTVWDDEPKSGRLYVSAAMRTKNDAYQFKDGHRSYSVNHVSVYSFLSLPKLSKPTNKDGWGNTAVSGVRKNDNGQDTGQYLHEKSIVNMYDNVFQLAMMEKAKRTIYVQHLDTEGNLLPEFANSYQNKIEPTNEKLFSTKPDKTGFHEMYQIETGERLEIRKSDKDGSTINNKIYTFSHGTAAKGPEFDVAVRQNPHFSWKTPTASFTTDLSGKDDVVVIRLYYNVEVPKEKERLQDLTLVGKLCFINELDSKYSNATTGDNVDYVPITSGGRTKGRLTPYVNNAYPYVVRGLAYEDKSYSDVAKASITTSITYYYSEWKYYHTGNESQGCPKLICGRSEHTHTDSCISRIPDDPDTPQNEGYEWISCGRSEHTHDPDDCYVYHDGCDWRHTTKSDTISKVLDYSVPYTHIWYQIQNLKIYKLSHLEVYDNVDNVGGELFSEGGGIYRVNVSDSYNRRFSNSTGLNRAKIQVSFPSSSYTLTSIWNNTMSKPANNTSTAGGTIRTNESTTRSSAQSQIDAQTHEVAAQRQNLTITYTYHNDFVELDSYRLTSTQATSMVNKNQKSWSEPIRSQTVSERILDSTRAFGYSQAGVDNGSKIAYTANLNNFMRPTSALTKKYDFVDNYQEIPTIRENGIRELTGRLYYTLVRDSKYDIGSDTFDATDYTYEINTNYPPNVYGDITPVDLADQNKYYSGDDVNKVNVFTPVSLTGLNLSSSERVDHTAGGVSNTLTLQKNAFFTISANPSSFYDGSYSFSDTREFIKGYYFICNFEIFYETPEGNLEYVPPFRAVYVDGSNAVFKAKPIASFGDVATDYKSNAIKVVAVTKNITKGLKNYYDAMFYTTTQYLEENKNTFTTSSTQRQVGLLTRNDIVADGYHAAYRIINSINLGRLFDFAVTDCTDLAFKDVFRKTGNGNVNESTGNIYYSGIKRWDYESLGYNDYVYRANQKLTLPLGPYKHTNPNVIAAPKLGYRISFDLKTTGYMVDDNRSNTRTVKIIPSYYFVSKDGTRYIKNIRLFYKNQNGNYVPFENSGYKIYFRPNDGYRYLRDSSYINNFETMSTKLEALDVSGNNMILTNKMMGTTNDSFIQAWYGEYKLPNSTIAVEVDGSGKYDINKPLTDGYIGVKFDIRSSDVGGYTLYYNTNDKSASSSNNTSQWDYEGYLGFNSPGSSFSGSLKLEKGIWNINETLYDEIKGTVVLFDIDNRAADDFQ